MIVTKRPHTKSRAGCQGCRKRRIKCDETHPTCKFCKDRDLRCNYGRQENGLRLSSSKPLSQIECTSRSSPPGSSNSAYIMSSHMLPEFPLETNVLVSAADPMQQRLMHNWYIATHDSLSVSPYRNTKNTWQIKMLRLGIEHQFLMDSILGVSSLHLQYLHPGDEGLQHLPATFQDRAIRGFRLAIADISLSNYEAVLATSLLFIAMGMSQHNIHLENELWISHWLGLNLGVRSLLITLGWKNIQASQLWSIFDLRDILHPVRILPTLPSALQAMIWTIDPEDCDWPYLQTLNHTMALLGNLYALLTIAQQSTLELDIEVRAWAAQVSPTFNMLVKELRPRALVITAHYLAFCRVITQAWWMRDTASREIRAIEKAVPVKWRQLLEIPYRSLESDSREAIIGLLLGQRF